ncbi:hypothetical protein [Gelidibacter japonicus]|uniref:hypothetical protein n=1 Tax=Gelidibacter japonicus TaxID=1962232 RepID=UPI0013D334ED|nr:hypothetical protein [Gelidibacter japonicus]
MIILPVKKHKEINLLIGFYNESSVQFKIFKASDSQSTKKYHNIETEILENILLYFQISSTNSTTDPNSNYRSSNCWGFLGPTGSSNCYMGMQNYCTGEIRFVDTCGKMEEDEEENWDWGDADDNWADDDYGDDIADSLDDDNWEWGDGSNDTEHIKVVNELTGRALCVYEKLENSNSNLFKETIGKFIDDPKYDLIFKNGMCSKNAAACTNSQNISSTGEVIIKINYLSGSVLEDAALILHEGIHAEIARYVQRHKTGEDPNDRARMFQLYKFYKESQVPEEHLDHPYMTLNYINPIASALRKLDGNRYPLDYYKSFAWDGLRNWDVTNLLGIEESSEIEIYRDIVNANTNLSCD